MEADSEAGAHRSWVAAVVTTVEAEASLGLQLVTLEPATCRNGLDNHLP